MILKLDDIEFNLIKIIKRQILLDLIKEIEEKYKNRKCLPDDINEILSDLKIKARYGCE